MMEKTEIFKTCSICKGSKNISEFYKDVDKTDGVRSSCKVCFSSRKMELYRMKNPYPDPLNKRTFMDEEGMKVCCLCNKNVHFSQFRKDKDRHDGLSSKCKPCANSWHREYRKKNPGLRERYEPSMSPEEASVYQRNNWLKKRFNITQDKYWEMFESQSGGCAICGKKTPGGRGSFHIDHDHVSGNIRGLLCRACNMGLGQFRDDAGLMRLATKYLENSQPSKSEADLTVKPTEEVNQ